MASLEDTALIPRDALFGNPERALVQISPDGRYLSWVAPLDGVLNVWVAPADDPAAATAVTRDTARGVRTYTWTYRPGILLYQQDTGGDEDYHLYLVDVDGDPGQARDLTPYEDTLAQIVEVSHRHPESVVVGLNDRDAQWHDLYRIDLTTGERTLLEENSDQIAGYLVDADYQPRMALRSRPDGGMDVLGRDGDGWETTDLIPYEDAMTSAPLSLTEDGSTLYLLDSRGRNTTGLYAVSTADGERTLVHEDDRADVADLLTHPRTGRVEAVGVNYLRREWAVVDEAVRDDLDRLADLGPGEAEVTSRTLDDRH